MSSLSSKPKAYFTLKKEMFPSLNSTVHVNDSIPNPINQKNKFSTLFNNNSLEKEEPIELNKEKEEKEEKEGWVTLKKGISYTNSKNTCSQLEEVKEEQVDPYKVFEKLTKLYEKWKKNYIELWGYDDYEKNYRFPNYDYSYLESEDFEEEEFISE
jgi:hypothetical protein